MPRPPSIVYHKIAAQACWVIPPPGQPALVYHDVTRDMVSDTSVVYLVDIGATSEKGALRCPAFTVVVASPRAKGKDIVQHWSSHAMFPPTLYMPCWDEAELQLCRRTVAPTDAEQDTDKLLGLRSIPSLSSEVVSAHVREFGGIARTAFTPDSRFPGIHRRLRSAIESCDLDVVGSQAGRDLDLLPESSSWLLHYVVDPASFELVNIQFASSHILHEVYNRTMQRNQDKVLRFVDATSQNTVWSSARGNIFELCLSHDFLQAGGTFPVQQFVDPCKAVKGEKGKRHPLTSQLLVKPSQQTTAALKNATDIARLAAGQYGQPSTSSFPTVDGILRPNLLFQMTVSASHDVNIDGLIAAVNALQLRADDPPPRLYFVVPPQQFATFQPGTFTSSSTPPTPVSAIPKRVEYWVLQLYPLSRQAIGAIETGLPSVLTKRKASSASASLAGGPVILPPPGPGVSSCSCAGPCRTSQCSCRSQSKECNSQCHSRLADRLTNKAERHKNCENHQ